MPPRKAAQNPQKCSLPLTGVEVVDTIVTELCLLRVTDRGLVVKELRADVALEDVEKITDARLLVEGEIKAMVF